MSTSHPWLARRVLGVAHQGGHEGGPPSTIAAMRTALANGAAMLELDAHGTGDRPVEVVVTHDRTIDGNRIAKTPLAVLRRARPDLATLDEVLSTFRGVPLTVELKGLRAARPTVNLLAGEGAGRIVLVASFIPFLAGFARRRVPGASSTAGNTTTIVLRLLAVPLLRLLVPRRTPRQRHEVVQVEVDLGRRVSWLRWVTAGRSRAFVDTAHRRGYAVHVWTVNDPATMDLVVRAGADGITTDVPSVLTPILDRHGVRWPNPA